VSAPKVVSMRAHAIKNLQAVRVDRASQWGNPFLPTGEGDRDRICDLYELYAQWRLTVDPHWLDELKGKNLACWCAPKRCHADTLLRLANDLSDPLPFK
jgi:hypothetical protein